MSGDSESRCRVLIFLASIPTPCVLLVIRLYTCRYMYSVRGRGHNAGGCSRHGEASQRCCRLVHLAPSTISRTRYSFDIEAYRLFCTGLHRMLLPGLQLVEADKSVDKHVPRRCGCQAPRLSLFPVEKTSADPEPACLFGTSNTTCRTLCKQSPNSELSLRPEYISFKYRRRTTSGPPPPVFAT